ncbi:hypothetical protein RIF29_20927 [Crotalaria pallida]|uniref:Co-chaperone protein p23 n=1 Tax=Crotalaria pallida TaxID=3830 RepID=A0AAN9F1Z8_CROPI
MDTVSEFFKVKEALGSSETADEALSAFKKMEKSGTFNERDLGLASVFVGFKLHAQAQHAMQPMMGKVSGEVESRHPSVKWAQRSDELYITVELPDAQDVKVKLEPEGKFYFTATAGEEKIPYEVNIDLFDKVDVNNSKACVGSRNIFYLVKKAESKWWDRMLKQGGKSPVFLKVDWEKWVDEDEEEEADKSGFDMDFGDIFCSKLNMGGGEGLGDNNDDHNKSEVTGEASAYNAPDSKGHGGQHS